MYVTTHRYGIKGPVYLRSKEGQVVYISETDQPQWTSGTVHRSWTSITVDSVLGSHTYNLFDHVTVSTGSKTIIHQNDYAYSLHSG